MPRLEMSKYESEEKYRIYISRLIEQKYVGGFCIFGGTLESVPIILDELQGLAKKTSLPPLLMSCDCEWGLPMRLHSGGTEFPHFMALERMNDQKGIRQVAKAIGDEMSVLGLHWNFAPVADVNSNPNNPIINIRAFSGDPEIVAECATSFYEGLEDASIIATAKHFPGHGDTHIDSHSDLPIIDKSFEEFDSLELVPFKRIMQGGIPSIMTGHIAAPKLAEKFGAKGYAENLPTTISSYLTQKLLREYLSFEGIIITDSLEMHGLRKIMSHPGEIASHAFAAGADILLMPTDPIAAYKGLKDGIDRGAILLENVDKSIIRIEKLRDKYLTQRLPKIAVQWVDHQQIAYNAAKRSINLEGNIPKPLLPSSVLIIASNSEREKRQKEITTMFFGSRYPGLSVRFADEGFNEELGKNPLIIIMHRPRGMLTGEINTESVSVKAKTTIQKLKGTNTTPTGIVCFGDPYIADNFRITNPDFILCTYSDSIPSVIMALELLNENI